MLFDRAIKLRFDVNEQTSRPQFQRHSGDVRNALTHYEAYMV